MNRNIICKDKFARHNVWIN